MPNSPLVSQQVHLLVWAGMIAATIHFAHKHQAVRGTVIITTVPAGTVSDQVVLVKCIGTVLADLLLEPIGTLEMVGAQDAFNSLMGPLILSGQTTPLQVLALFWAIGVSSAGVVKMNNEAAGPLTV